MEQQKKCQPLRIGKVAEGSAVFVRLGAESASLSVRGGEKSRETARLWYGMSPKVFFLEVKWREIHGNASLYFGEINNFAP